MDDLDSQVVILNIDGKDYFEMKLPDPWRTGEMGANWTFTRSAALNWDRAQRVYEHFMDSLSLEGDVAEFGVYKGTTGRNFAEYLVRHDFEGKRVHLLDTFWGLPHADPQDLRTEDGKLADFDKQNLGRYRGRLADVEAVLGEYADICELHEGLIESTGAAFEAPLCFAHVDCDLYAGTLAALNCCDRVVVPGGCVVIDDWGTEWAGVCEAVQEWFDGSRWELNTASGSCWAIRRDA